MNRAFVNVGYELTESQLHLHFVQFGAVSDTYLPKHSSGRNKGFAFVTFDSAEALERALLAPAHSVDGVVVQVKRAGPRPPVADPEVPATSGPSETQMQQPFGKGPRLYVGGVADAVSEERIYQHFTKWGSVTDVYFPGKRGQRRVNYCFVTFDDWAAAQQACNQSDRNIDGSPLDCITMAGARQQDMPASLGRSGLPHSMPVSHAAQHVAAAQSEPLASLPAYASWLPQHSDHSQAASAVQPAFVPTPLGHSFGTAMAHHSCLSLIEQQHVFMQGVHAGMQINSLSAAGVQAPTSGSGSSTNSWSNLQLGLSPSAPAAGLQLPPHYLDSAKDSQIGMYSNMHQQFGTAESQPYERFLYR